MNQPDFLRPPEVANRLSMSTKGVLSMLKKKKLPGVKIGHLWRIPRVEFEEWVARVKIDARLEI